MSIIVRPNLYVPGTVIRSAEVNDDLDTIYNNYNGFIDNTNIAPGAGIEVSKFETMNTGEIIIGTALGVPTIVAMSGDATIDDAGAVSLASNAPGVVPLGTIIPIYDFNGAITYGSGPTFDVDTDKWPFCDGSATTVKGNPQTLPDMSNRYLVGFGTEGGGDVGTAAWNAAAVGNASHQVNIQHTHINTLTASNLTVSGTGSGTSTGQSTNSQSTSTSGNASVDHTHDSGSLKLKIGYTTCVSHPVMNLYFYNSAGTALAAFSTTSSGATDFVCNITANLWPSASAFNVSGGGADLYTNGGIGATGGQSVTHSHNIAHTHGVSGGTVATTVTGTATHGTAQHTLTNVAAGSTTQDIQPRSIRVRYVMRVA